MDTENPYHGYPRTRRFQQSLYTRQDTGPIDVLLEQYAARVLDTRIEMTFTQFTHEYMMIHITEFMLSHPMLFPELPIHSLLNSTIQGMSKLAFSHLVRNKTIDIQAIQSIFPDCQNADHILRMSFGLLGPVEHDRSRYSFPPCIEEYLVSWFQVKEIMTKLTGRHFHTLSYALTESMKLLPATADIWRFTFGTLQQQEHYQYTSSASRFVFKELLYHCFHVARLETAEIVALCLDIIFEAKNKGSLSSIFENDFLRNSTIDLSNFFLTNSRRSHTLQSVGYLVLCSDSLYGVNMNSFKITSRNIEYLCRCIPGGEAIGLGMLNLSNNHLGSDGMKRFGRLLKNAPCLSHLNLQNNQLGDEGVKIFSECLAYLPLTYLELSGNQITDDGMANFIDAWQYCPTIEYLFLSSNYLTDTSLLKLADNITILSKLKTLDLRSNSVSNLGAKAMAESLQKVPFLAKLHLSENQIEEEGAVHSAKLMLKAKSLNYVNLNTNQISRVGLNELHKAATTNGSIDVHAHDQCYAKSESIIGSTCSLHRRGCMSSSSNRFPTGSSLYSSSYTVSEGKYETSDEEVDTQQQEVVN